jgi:hypothetical protein
MTLSFMAAAQAKRARSIFKIKKARAAKFKSSIPFLLSNFLTKGSLLQI